MKKESENSRKVQRRQAILAAAMGVFAAKGYSTATCDDIAEAAGVSKGTLYNYFDSKQDLFTQLFQEIVSEDEAETDAVVGQDTSASEKLKAVIQRWFDRMESYDQIGRLVMEFWATAAAEDQDGLFVTTLKDLYSRYRARLAAIFKQGEDSGEFKLIYGPNLASASLMALMDGLGLHRMMGMGLKIDKTLVDGIQTGMLRAMGVEIEPQGTTGHTYD